MRIFKQGESGYVVDRDGAEARVRVISRQGEGMYLVVWIDGYGHQTGSPFLAANGKVLAPKGPFFDIRGQVLTTSSSHPGEVGQIVGRATSKSGKTFFNVSFKDGTSEWFCEDQVFIDDEVRRVYEETAKDGEFF
jgi:hypothetical protein